MKQEFQVSFPKLNKVAVMFSWFKWLVCREELMTLNRYRIACIQVIQWNASIPPSAKTARWIREFGEGTRSNDIEKFRESLRATQNDHDK